MSSKWKPKIPSYTSEDMSQHYDTEVFGISFKNKIILDLGASNGDSAEFFLFKGAKCVIAVEGGASDANLYAQLELNSKLFNEKMIPIHLQIEKPKDIENLILEYKPDILKSDIEGAEIHLLNIKDEIWKLVPEYLVEMHEGYGFVRNGVMWAKCAQTNYIILKEICIISDVLYAVRI